MKSKLYLHAILSIIALLVMLGCDLTGAAIKATETPAAISSGGKGGNNGNNGSSSGGSNGANPGAGTPVPSASPTVTVTETETPTPTPRPGNGPYLVKQTQHRGDEVITGVVCDLTRPFTVNVQTKPITFNWGFVPATDRKGAYSDAYSFPSLGETHDAKGNYTVTGPDPTGMLTLSMAGQDHVVFKGFDGNIPFSYSFGLVPVDQPGCP